MKIQGSNGSQSGLCVITVCVDRDTVEKVKAATLAEHGTFAGELQGYSLQEGELQPLLKVQNAELSVCMIDFDQDRALAVQAANSHAPDAARANHAVRALAAIRSHVDCGSHARRLQRISQQAAVGRAGMRVVCAFVRAAFRGRATSGVRARSWLFWAAGGAPAPPRWRCIWARFWPSSFGKKALIVDQHPASGTRGVVPGARRSFLRFLRTGA